MVTSAVAGEGKSTTTANLAVALARAGRDVVLVELDLRRPSLARLFGIPPRPGVTEVVLGGRSIDTFMHVDSARRVSRRCCEARRTRSRLHRRGLLRARGGRSSGVGRFERDRHGSPAGEPARPARVARRDRPRRQPPGPSVERRAGTQRACRWTALRRADEEVPPPSRYGRFDTRSRCRLRSHWASSSSASAASSSSTARTLARSAARPPRITTWSGRYDGRAPVERRADRASRRRLGRAAG